MPDRPPGLIIAVVDDDKRVLESLQDLLASADHTVRLFASATAFLESGCLAQIDCLISDIGMPVMDGLELLRMVQAARPELPIVLITGCSDMLKRVSPVEAGRYRLLRKPFDGQELLTAVTAMLPGSHLRRS